MTIEDNFIDYEYDAIAFKQSREGCWVVSFSSSATEILKWAGIPQKKHFDNVESSGFQRVIRKERMNSLINFFQDPKNVIQNPLLCAARNHTKNDAVGAFFSQDTSDNTSDFVQKGKIKIRSENFHRKSLKELLASFRETLESRVPALRDLEIDQDLLKKIKDIHYEENTQNQNEDEESLPNIENEVELEDSHIYDLWQEIKCREVVLLEDTDNSVDQILGFDKQSIISYLLPITLVDGQHRLMGAVEHFNYFKDSSEGQKIVEELSESDITTTELSYNLEKNYCRRLPVSLILSEDPAEHVFQFVVVNQKATPINSALLGTIVSTTLSSDELDRVSHRLKNADIPLEDSKAVSFATRDSESPFHSLVQTGISGESSGKLPWTVMKGLVSIFKDLKGAKYFSDTVKTDFADLWKRRVLEQCEIVPGSNIDEKIDNWSKDDGVWRVFFISFWSKIRDEFGSIDDDGRQNYWGNTSSNLFNKISLTILASDYFKFIATGRVKIDTISDIDESIDEWLFDVDRSYFDRDWLLKNTKKDSPGIRKQWSHLWMNYREDPRKLPAVNSYRISFSGA